MKLSQLLKIDQVEDNVEKKGPVDFTTHNIEYPIPENNFERAGEAASVIKRVMTNLGMDTSVIRRAAVAAYEAEMNVVLHASQGLITAVITPTILVIKLLVR
ncbi:MAG: hypothetical protein PHO01_11995 [Desulfotomaculaceae bacterium]|nr:hypothetical protein [Desulfotomaculaceae bacterium]